MRFWNFSLRTVLFAPVTFWLTNILLGTQFSDFCGVLFPKVSRTRGYMYPKWVYVLALTNVGRREWGMCRYFSLIPSFPVHDVELKKKLVVFLIVWLMQDGNVLVNISYCKRVCWCFINRMVHLLTLSRVSCVISSIVLLLAAVMTMHCDIRCYGCLKETFV